VRKRAAFAPFKINCKKESFVMKKQFKLLDLDCASCAAKMEQAIRKLDGVHGATVSFLAQKLTLDADDARFDEILRQVITVCRKVEPDCTIVL